MTALALAALALAALPAALYARNVKLFRPPTAGAGPFAVSVLIPARNEEAGIAACVESVREQVGVEFEVIVLDDHSTDRTAEVVREIGRKDARVRVEPAPPLPAGWCGKQHACYALSKLAKHDLLTFLDADVRLTDPLAIAKMANFRLTSGGALVSGFPRQETGTLLEKLVIPLIHFLLLGFLPFGRMRASIQPGLGAGCGQWFLTTREAYEKAGGHAAVRESLHDGVKLPRAYRQAGLTTDLCDVTDLAACRMYRSAAGVWNGLAKNAHEGLGSPRLIVFTTLLLAGGQVLPFALVPFVATMPTAAVVATLLAAVLAWYPRVDAMARFRQSPLGALSHPVGVLSLLGIQWYAAVRAAVGKPVGWKGRPAPGLSSGDAPPPG